MPHHMPLRTSNQELFPLPCFHTKKVWQFHIVQSFSKVCHDARNFDLNSCFWHLFFYLFFIIVINYRSLEKATKIRLFKMYDKVSKRNNHNFLFDMSFLKSCVNNILTMSDFHLHFIISQN